MNTPSPSLAARNWTAAVRAVGAAGELCRAATTKREHKSADTHRKHALALEAAAWEQLCASRAAYLDDAQREDADGLPENHAEDFPDIIDHAGEALDGA